MVKTLDSSEVGGVRTKWPQPGNRFVSFVRASGRAGEIKMVCLNESAEGSSFAAAAAAPSLGRRCLAVLARVFEFLLFSL